ncbi:MAG: hypothetical protein FWG12_01630 [Holophagaceae bacterium]|nr:hypothetical protein [Holophagaceae bacterium]
MKQFIYIFLLQLLAAVTLFSGDLTITYKVKARALLVISTNATLVEYHSSQYKRVSNQKEQTDTLFDYGNFVKYSVNHKEKVINKITLDDLMKAAEMITQAQRGNPENSSNMEEAMKKVFGDTSKQNVKNTGTEVVVNRRCDKWTISLGKFTAKISVDPGIVPSIPQDGKVSLLEYLAPRSLGIPGFADTVVKFFELTSQKGIPLKSDIVMPIGPITAKIYKEATEVVEGAIPASVFELPKGYKEIDRGKTMLEDLAEKLKNIPKNN